ncbi:hypothetical protein RUM43_006202, partial [Polyplax serrata]
LMSPVTGTRPDTHQPDSIGLETRSESGVKSRENDMCKHTGKVPQPVEFFVCPE